MIQLLTDEEVIAHADKLIETVTAAIISTRNSYPGTSVEALSQVLYMVNGVDWISSSDMARARVAAKHREATRHG